MSKRVYIILGVIIGIGVVLTPIIVVNPIPCWKNKGTLEHTGSLNFVCNYSDGGEKCTDSSECSGRCIAKTGFSGTETSTKVEAEGVCEDNDEQECFREVKDGVVDLEEPVGICTE